MKRALIWAGFVVVGAVAGVTGYYWTQATYLPRWYGQSGATLSGETATASDLLNTQVATAQPATEGQIVLNEAELNRVVVDAIANAPQAEKLLAIAKGINTSIQSDRIQSGVVLNLADIPADALPPQGQQALEQLTQSLPMLANRDVYIGIQGRPQIVDGRLVLDDSTVINIGRLKIPLSDVASQLGMTSEELANHLAGALAASGLRLEDIQLSNGQITLQGGTPSP